MNRFVLHPALISFLASALTACIAEDTTKLALTVALQGTGQGRVTSGQPVPIDCASTCTVLLNSGTSVQLTANASTGSVFTGWSGACSGTGACAVMMDLPKTVAAGFDLAR